MITRPPTLFPRRLDLTYCIAVGNGSTPPARFDRPRTSLNEAIANASSSLKRRDAGVPLSKGTGCGLEIKGSSRRTSFRT